jgi:hypothetical protein
MRTKNLFDLILNNSSFFLSHVTNKTHFILLDSVNWLWHFHRAKLKHLLKSV